MVLRLKYHKTTLFLTCQPSTPLSVLKDDFLSAVRATNQPELSTLPQYTQPDAKPFPEWNEMNSEKDVGLFVAGSTGDESIEGMTIFMPLDQDSASPDATVRKAGLKDSDAVCVGFRARGASKYACYSYRCRCAEWCMTDRSIILALLPSSHVPTLFSPIETNLEILRIPQNLCLLYHLCIRSTAFDLTKASISQPIVQFTDVEEEEDDAVDPDSIPPPLSD